MARPHPPSLARFGVAATTAPPPRARAAPPPPIPAVPACAVAPPRRCPPPPPVPAVPELASPAPHDWGALADVPRHPPPWSWREGIDRGKVAGRKAAVENGDGQRGGGASNPSAVPPPTAAALPLRVQSQARDINKIQALLDEMKRKNVAGDVFFYTAVINAYCRAGNVRRASEVFDECVGNGIEPNEHTYGAVINGFCKIGQMEAAEMLLADMQARGVINRVRSLE